MTTKMKSAEDDILGKTNSVASVGGKAIATKKRDKSCATCVTQLKW